ncbi:MAG: Ldh family oxidoreductase [Tranquillimonas sp.]
MDSSRIGAVELRDLAEAAFRAHGVAAPQARDAAQVLIRAEMMGIVTHGAARIPEYTERIVAGGIDPAAAIAIGHPAPGLLRVDGADGLGPAILMQALRAARPVAEELGLAAAFCRRSAHVGALAPYLLTATEWGMIALVATNASAMMAPAGGRAARLGNNPLGLGFPDPDGRVVLLDMALSTVSRSRLRQAAAEGGAIPPDWAVDAAGRPAADPAAALAGLLGPAGGHKGAGLALAVDLLAGLWSGAAFLTRVPDSGDARDRPRDLGQVVLLIDARRLLAADEAAERMAAFRRIVEETPPADPDCPVRLPGDRAMARLRRAEAEGVDLPAPLLTRIIDLATGR